MASMAPKEDTVSTKGASTVVEFHTLVEKPSHHHVSRWNQQASRQSRLPIQDQDAVQFLLTRSIGLALDAVGFTGAEAIAVESFRAEVEEYITHFLADVRQSMLSSRRVQAIPQDFLQALHMNQLSLRSLIPHLDPPVSPSRSQFSLEVATADGQGNLEIACPLPGSQLYELPKAYVPRHFPDFPSKHSYKATAEYSELERDPRKLRELAMEEGRMGEEALRRLLGSASGRLSVEKSDTGHAKKGVRMMRDDLWKETILAVSPVTEPQLRVSNAHQDLRESDHEKTVDAAVLVKRHMGSAVNADKKYWRKSTSSSQKHVQHNSIG